MPRATTSTGTPVPDTAFAAVPANPTGYWAGYAAGMNTWIPNPGGLADFYQQYVPAVAGFLLPTSHMGLVDNVAVGFNAAITDCRDWLWVNDPNSGHNKVIA